MQKSKAKLGFIAAVAILALPSAASAEHVVPPGNSAANQYTETFPTAKGQATTKQRGKTRDRSPRQVLGSTNARRLQSEGPEGQELATVVATTAPPPKQGASPTGAAPRGDGFRADVDSSSALSEIVRQVSGSSEESGGMGIALPLLILAALVGFALYAWRRRRLAA